MAGLPLEEQNTAADHELTVYFINIGYIWEFVPHCTYQRLSRQSHSLESGINIMNKVISLID